MVGQMNQNDTATNLVDDVTLLLLKLAMTSGCTALSTEFKTTDSESELKCAEVQQIKTHYDPVQYRRLHT